jgi:hypothetical protein
VLIKHFLDEHNKGSGGTPVGISRGALEKLLQQNWPGNIRELKNCITRSLAFAECEILQTNHILFDERGYKEASKVVPVPSEILLPENFSPQDEDRAEGQPANNMFVKGRNSTPAGLNSRQRKAWPVISRNGIISRSEYQDAVGEPISVRTAQYDLQDMVTKGMLKKSGRGPSSRYLVAQSYVI